MSGRNEEMKEGRKEGEEEMKEGRKEGRKEAKEGKKELMSHTMWGNMI